MSTRDQLEIISPTGEIKFYTLDPARGITNIGRHPDNDIVIDSPDVSAFHAVVYHWQKPIQIILMGADGKTTVGGQPIQSRTSHPLQNWDTIELDGYTLVLMEGAAAGAPVSGPAAAAPLPTPPLPAPAAPSAAAPTPMPPPAAAPQAESPAAAATVVVPAPLETIAAPLPDHVDEVVVTEVSAREFTLDVEQTATFDVLIANGGDIVATFMVSVEGLDPYWVLVSPAQVNLNEGERATVQVTITPPRASTSRAGLHNFAVTVSSPDYPGRFSRTATTLTVNPYYDHAIGELSPKQQRYSWFKRTGQVKYTVANRGNSEAPFRIDANDDERACLFEFKLSEGAASLARQAELRLQPEESRTVTVIMTLLKRRFFGLSDNYYSYTVTTTPLQGQMTPRSMLGQAQSSALIGMWHIIAALLLLAVLIAFIFRPGISDFSADLPQVLSSEIMDGQKVTLSWQASWFSHVTIDQGVGAIESSEASVEVAPLDTTTYRLTATTRLLDLIARNWFSASREITVVVDPVEPIVRFNVDKAKVVIGQPVTISWQVLNAEEVVLLINGAPETLPPVQHTGSRVIAPEGETQVTLQARNRYTTGDGIVTTRIINADRPTETPLPPPVIQRFDVLPSPIIEGEEVTLEWSVAGVSEVTIEGLGSFPPSGRLIEKPTTTTAYRLIATNGQQTAISLKEVVVNPAPTPTPVPGTPNIDFFTAAPIEVALGSPEAENIQLAWAVSGDYTSIELTSEIIGKITGLEKQGTRIVAVGERDTQFVLTAFNGALSASQTVQVKVIVPVPVISSLNPASRFASEPGFTLVVTGANFVNGATVRWNGVDRPSTYVSNTQLTAVIPASDVAKAGVGQVTVFNPAAAGGNASSAVNFNVNNPQPVLSSINPITITVGSADVTLTATGSGFITDSKVRWNGIDLATTFSSSSTLIAVVPANNVETAGQFTITVFNPSPVGGSSGGQTFTAANPIPEISSLGPPSSVKVGSDAFTMTILGSGFVGGSKGSQVSWNGLLRTAIFDSESQLRLTVPKADVATAGTVDIAVVNPPPGGGPSPTTVQFQIEKNDVVVSVNPNAPSAVSGQAVNFTVTVSAAPSSPAGLPIPTGNVKLKYGSTELPAVPLDATGAAAFNNLKFPVGAYDITAEYDGSDALFDADTSAPLNYSVTKADVNISITGDVPSPSIYGVSLRITAVVTAASPGSDDPVKPNGGLVQFLSDGALIATAPVVDGVAYIDTDLTDVAVLLAGDRNLSASYDSTAGTPDPNFNSGGPSPIRAHTVTERLPTLTLSVASSSTFGDLVTFTADVSSGLAGLAAPADNGTVKFYIDGTEIATGLLSGGLTSVQTDFTQSTTYLTGGDHNITAQYQGEDPNFLASVVDSNGTRAHTVNRRTVTSVSIAGIGIPGGPPGLAYWGPFTATWTAGVNVPGGYPTPGGSVTFYYSSQYSTDDCIWSGYPYTRNVTAGLSGGSATRSESITIYEGAFQIYVIYNGDQNYASGASSDTLWGFEICS